MLDMLVNLFSLFLLFILVVFLVVIYCQVVPGCTISLEDIVDRKIKHVNLDYNYRNRNFFFTDAEKNFLETLKKVVADKYYIYGKVRIADLIEPNFDKRFNHEKWWRSFNAISQKHVDFVLTDKNYNVICVIELNDKSHQKKDRIKSDEIKRKAFHSAEIPLLFFNNSYEYSHSHIKGIIDLAILEL